jgi:hypothetical protein
MVDRSVCSARGRGLAQVRGVPQTPPLPLSDCCTLVLSLASPDAAAVHAAAHGEQQEGKAPGGAARWKGERASARARAAEERWGRQVRARP